MGCGTNIHSKRGKELTPMTSRERVLAALTGDSIPDRVPFMDLGVDHVVARAILGKDSFTPLEVADTLGLDAIGYPLYPEIYTVNQTADDGRSYIVGGRLHSRADLGMVKPPSPRTPGYMDGAKRFLDRFGGERAIYAATNIGWDPVLLGMGLEYFSYAVYDDPGLIREILARYTEWSMEMVDEVQRAGFDFIWLTDDLAYKTGPMFSPDVFRELLLPGARPVAESIRLPWAFHSDGNLAPILDDLLGLGMNGLHPIEPGAMDIRELKQTIGHKVCLIGNVDVGELLTLGTPGQVREAVKALIRDLSPGGRYIISSSNSIAAYCKPENVLAMAEAVRDSGGAC